MTEKAMFAPNTTIRPDAVERLLPVLDALQAVRTAVRASKGGASVDYDISKVLGYVDTLFTRFAPFKPGDVVEVTTARHEDLNDAPGWHGQVKKGRRGTVRSVDCGDGYFNAMVELHNQTWTDERGTEHPVERPALYCLWETSIAKVQP